MEKMEEMLTDEELEMVTGCGSQFGNCKCDCTVCKCTVLANEENGFFKVGAKTYRKKYGCLFCHHVWYTDEV